MPPRSASTKTTTSGKARNSPRNPSATAIRTALTGPASVVGARRRAGGVARATSDIAKSPARPCLDQVDHEEHHEGDRQHEGGDRGRARVVVLLETDDDEQRRNLGA